MHDHPTPPNYTRRIQVQLIVLALLLGVLVGPSIFGTTDANTASTSAAVEAVNPVHVQEVLQPTDPHFSGLRLEASSVYVWDIHDRRVLYAKNDRTVLPLASLTKMMMGLVAVEMFPEDKRVTVRAQDLLEEGESGLRVGETWKLADLIDYTLVVSSNDGASAIAAAAASLGQPATVTPEQAKDRFVAAMNTKARAIGLEATTFSNASGLDVSSYTTGAKGTARDMAKLFTYIWEKHPDLFAATAREKILVSSTDNIAHRGTNTNEIVGQIPGIIGSKTGYTDLAGGNLAVITDIGINHPVVIVVLGSSREGRFRDVATLLTAATHAVNNAYAR